MLHYVITFVKTFNNFFIKIYILVGFGLSDNDPILLLIYNILIGLYYMHYYTYYLLMEIQKLNIFYKLASHSLLNVKGIF